jgi:hypothetical protein
MKTILNFRPVQTKFVLVTVLLLNLCFSQFVKAFADDFTEYKGIVLDKQTNKPLAFASIFINGSGNTTVTNSDGEFSVKLPVGSKDIVLTVKYIGYKNFSFRISELLSQKGKILLEPVNVELPEVSVISKDADALIEAMLDKKGVNYADKDMSLTTFYRESIRKNKTYVSLAEAVIDITKPSYSSYRNDVVKLYKSRKKTDYNRLDTLVFKLMGGPFNSLYLDIMKHTDLIFTENRAENYVFSFDRSTRQDDRLIYVIDFRQNKNNPDPLYYGKLYIDAESLALKSAVFNLNLEKREEAARMFIVKKPLNAKVFPVNASYRIDYFEKDGKWYYGYSRIELGLRINWKKKLFNTTYYSTIEMATTDIIPIGATSSANKARLRPNVIISDEASGFADPDFWGEFNVIEPEKSIETAIKKIQKQLEKAN